MEDETPAEWNTPLTTCSYFLISRNRDELGFVIIEFDRLVLHGLIFEDDNCEMNAKVWRELGCILISMEWDRRRSQYSSIAQPTDGIHGQANHAKVFVIG